MGRIWHLRWSVLAAFVVVSAGASARAQEAARGLSPARAALVKATEDYKAGTREMIRLKGAEIERAEKAHEQLKGLAADGLVARREVEESERALAALRAGLEGLNKQLTDSDHLIAEVVEAEQAERQAEAKAKELAKALAARPRLTLTSKHNAGGVVIRHAGGGNWSIAGLPNVQSFFYSTFGRPLPTSAVGQTATHDRMGFDHRRAVDVALHPDSVEGRALIGYLQANRIAFIAFRAAVPGSATGPHIHIGPPSHRL